MEIRSNGAALRALVLSYKAKEFIGNAGSIEVAKDTRELLLEAFESSSELAAGKPGTFESDLMIQASGQKGHVFHIDLEQMDAQHGPDFVSKWPRILLLLKRDFESKPLTKQ